MTSQALLTVCDLSKTYGSLEGLSIPVLSHLDLIVGRGESVAIMGPSGSGKSTLLNIIGTLDTPTSGRVRLEETELTALDATATAAIRNRRIGFVFQAHHLLPHCTALENVLIPTLAFPSGTKDIEERARHLLDRVGLSHRLNHRPGQLSGGERQRVAIVRALINRPQLLLADEPTGALDRNASEELASLLAQLNTQEGVTLIVATHASHLADRMQRVLELRDGKLHPVLMETGKPVGN